MDQIEAWLSALPLWKLYVIAGLVSLVLSRKSQVDEWAEAHPRIAGFMKTLRSVGLDPWVGLQGICLIVFGRLPTKPEVEPVKSKRKPPSGLLTLCLLIGVSFIPPVAVFGCSSVPKPTPMMVEASKALAFNSAVVVLVQLDHNEAAYLDSLESPTTNQIVAARQRVARLKAAREALVLVREWLEGDLSRDGDRALAGAVALLKEVVSLLRSEGAPVPAEVEQALELGGTYL